MNQGTHSRKNRKISGTLHWCVPALFFLCLYSSEAFGLSFQGTVHLVGSALKSRTLLEVTEPQQSNVLCQSDLEGKIRHLTDLEIEVSGDWRVGPTGEPDCLVVTSYKVLKASSGRAIIAGLLTSRAGQYIINTGDGAEVVLADLPSGAKSLVGTKVIVDVKSIASSSNVEAVKVIVSFRSMP